MNSPKFEPAAVRLLGRISLEGPEQTLSSVQLAAAALGELRGADTRRPLGLSFDSSKR